MTRYDGDTGEDEAPTRHRAPTLENNDLQGVPSTERTPLLAGGQQPSIYYRKQQRSRFSRYCCCCCTNWKYSLAITVGLIAISVILITLFVTSHSSGIILQLLSSLSSLSTCSTCFTLLVPVRQLALLGDSAFTKTFATLCTDLKIQPAEVCQGALDRQGPIIAQSLRQIQPNRRTAAALCTKLFGLCSSRGEPVSDWPTELFPKPDVRKRPAERSGKTKRVVQISDLHIDHLYRAGAEASCIGVMCCRDRGFLDKTTTPVKKAGPFGEQRCDAPPSLFKSMLDAIDEVAGDAEFVLSTGDIASHAVWEETSALTSKSILDAYAVMRAALKMPIYGTIGNHDIAPVNLFPTSETPRAFYASQWVYETHFTAWRDWIAHENNRSSFAEQVGCYAVTVKSMGLRIISLNTNFWSPDNFYLYGTENPPEDPQGILGYLMQELHTTESQGLRAILIGHSAPGNALPAQSHYFDQIIQRYRNTIVAQMYGHTHSSDFSVAYSTPAHKSAETASSVSFVSGALTPLGGKINPGFRVYELDEATGEVWNWKEYYTNITDPGFNDGPEWKVLYDARQEFGSLVPDSEGKPLGPSFWHSLTDVYQSSEEAFHRFIWTKFRGSPWGADKACRSERCRKYVLCGLRRSRGEEKCPREVTLSVPRQSPTIPDGIFLPQAEVEELSEIEHEHQMHKEGGKTTCQHGFGIKEILKGIAAKANTPEGKRVIEHHTRRAIFHNNPKQHR